MYSALDENNGFWVDLTHKPTYDTKMGDNT